MSSPNKILLKKRKVLKHLIYLRDEALDGLPGVVTMVVIAAVVELWLLGRALCWAVRGRGQGGGGSSLNGKKSIKDQGFNL